MSSCTSAATVRKPKATSQGPPSSKAKRGGWGKKTTGEDGDGEDTAAVDPKATALCIMWNANCTDQLVEWLEDNVEDHQRLFSDSAQDAKEQNHHPRTAKGSKTSFHVKMAEYILSIDKDEKVRDDIRANGGRKYAKAIENRIGSLKTKYREINTELGMTGAGLTAEQIRNNPELRNVLDRLILEHNLPIWDCLHRFWRTIPNFNPHAVLSEPGQDLEGEAQGLIFPSRGYGNVSEGEEPEDDIQEDEVEDVRLLGIIEGAARSFDIEDSLEGLNNDEPLPQMPARFYATPSVAIGGYDNIDVGAVPLLCKKALLSAHSRTPSVSTGSGYSSRRSSKCSCIDSSLNSIGDQQSQLAKIAKGLFDYKMAHLEVKHKKMELVLQQKRDFHRFDTKEKALVLKQVMQKKEFAHREWMMQYKLELVRLRAEQMAPHSGASSALGAHPVGFGEDDHTANAFPSEFPQSSFNFGTSAASSSVLPPLPSATWGSSETPVS